MHGQKCFDKRAPVFLQCRVCYLIRAVAGRFDTVKSICPASLRWMRASVGMKDVCSQALLCCLLCIVRVMTVCGISCYLEESILNREQFDKRIIWTFHVESRFTPLLIHISPS